MESSEPSEKNGLRCKVMESRPSIISGLASEIFSSQWMGAVCSYCRDLEIGGAHAHDASIVGVNDEPADTLCWLLGPLFGSAAHDVMRMRNSANRTPRPARHGVDVSLI